MIAPFQKKMKRPPTPTADEWFLARLPGPDGKFLLPKFEAMALVPSLEHWGLGSRERSHAIGKAVQAAMGMSIFEAKRAVDEALERSPFLGVEIRRLDYVINVLNGVRNAGIDKTQRARLKAALLGILEAPIDSVDEPEADNVVRVKFR